MLWNDWAALEFLGKLGLDPAICPRLFGGDSSVPFIVMEDLGVNAAEPHDLLDGAEPDRAEAALISYMQCLGQLHSATLMKLGLTVLTVGFLFASGSFGQETAAYGLQRGSVGVFGGGGFQVSGGAHPSVEGGLDVGLCKYLGLYGEGTYTLAYNANVREFFGGGGIMVAGTNRSRIVPFLRGGMDYGRLTVFRWGGMNVPAIRYGGGFDAYVTRHFGIETQVSGLRTVGNYGGDNIGFVTFGIFYRSK
jgi:hypothetical protein